MIARRSIGALVALVCAEMLGCGGGGDGSAPAPASGGAAAPAPASAAASASTSATGATTSSGQAAAPAAAAPPGVPTDPSPLSDPPAGTVISAAGCTFRYTIPPAAAVQGIDPLLGSLWHLGGVGGARAANDVHALEAWPTTKGAGSIVAVVDDGIELVHPDLYPNVLTGRSHDYRGGGRYPLPCASDQTHGTAVTGIIVARDDNRIGVAGIAPRASLVGYNALVTGLDSDVADAMLRQSDTVGVFHNSWGSFDDGFLNAAPQLWEAAIERGITDGRGRRGAVYVFASGNGGRVEVPASGGVTNAVAENSNFDGYINKRGIITACTVDETGRGAPYSERGANLLVCGPSGGTAGTRAITTTAVQAGYRSDFSGTSASAPMVSGVAALLLSAKPQLTWRDVQLILARSAQENDAADPSWLPSAVPGKRFSHRYGFGAVDAQAALALADAWASVGGAREQRACGPYARAERVPIGDAPGGSAPPVPLSDAIEIADCPIAHIEFVEVALSIEHPYSGDLSIRLVGPDGHASELADARSCGPGVPVAADPCRSRYDNWRFGSMRHMDEPVNGRWRLEITDVSPADAGALVSWSVRYWGR